MSEDYERVEVRSRAQWRRWLQANHERARGIWLVTYKQGEGEDHVAYDAVVEEALAFGWVDSQPRKLDERRSQLLVTPRKPGSSWSRKNRQRVERLLAEGRMSAAGKRAVDAAKADGSWSRLDAVEDLSEPPDLRAALDATPHARRHWDAFPPSTRRAILEWIGSAKREETRSRRVGETAALAAEDVRANQWRQPKRRSG